MPKLWKDTTLGAVITIKHGYAFKGEYFSDAGKHIVLTPGNFFDEGGFKCKAQEKYYTGPVPEDYVLRRGDLIVAMTEQAEGLLGSAAFVPESGVYLHNQRLGLVEPHTRTQACKRFLYYLFNERGVRQQIRSTCSGAKVRHTSPSRIYETRIEMPPLPTQTKIAAILSAYDDLIENNERRIRILEEMAQNLYREWFVKFRFLGHKKVKMVDSPLGKIPQGWEVKRLGDACHLVMGQSPPSEAYNENGDGLPFHQGVTNFGAHFPTDRVYCTIANRLAEGGDVLFSVRAPVGRMNLANKKIVLGRGLSAIRSKTGNQVFLFWQLRERFREEDTMGGGTIFKSVTKDEMQRIELLCPNGETVRLFESIVHPMLVLLETLTVKNAILRQTRDLLLPKLISGEVDVSELDVRVPE